MSKTDVIDYNIGLELAENIESREHRKWKIGVLVDHNKTSKLIKESINDIKKTRKTVRSSIRETRSVLNQWGKYEKDYGNACKELKYRILQVDEEEFE
eukprot:CAMPEP_0205811556 /NCGR_PEP_ID=MMETSP0205-20121125/15774_1 /ASSEMBLY_ACC=CAM_ASM_000278 /TAXON_ID=36767 /ORGANISM="Euplotes focardii, Strain TN1" /LENGTH=97 /DNA_ID=CAMNT_0053090881 /DNA_START=149 /DNA_END=439 /DNA_ORIENTATION=-